MTEQYIAPKLTRYGTIDTIIQAGSFITLGVGGGQSDTAFDTNGDSKADVVIDTLPQNLPDTAQ